MLQRIIDKYLNSRDYNGLPMYEIGNFNEEEIVDLIKKGLIEVISEREAMNPHIRGFQLNLSIDQQIENIRYGERHTCLYPTKDALKFVDYDASKPYTSAMRRGANQFDIIFFDVEILERYMNNPQYQIWDGGYRGTICIKDEYYKEGEKEDYIKDYGMAYIDGPRLNRAIGVFAIDLARLTAKTQMLWKAFELDNQKSCKVEAGFVKNLVYGEWVTKHWMLMAIIEEIKIINRQCKEIGLKPIFNKEFEIDSLSMPEGYRTILLPTEKNYNDFIMALEKIVVHNISIKPFLVDIGIVRGVERNSEDGSPKGSLVILEEWLNENIKANFDINEVIIEPLKLVRKIRQKPAHEIVKNSYNIEYYEKQELLVCKVFDALRALMMLLGGHPLAQKVVLPEHLKTGENVVFY